MIECVPVLPGHFFVVILRNEPGHFSNGKHFSFSNGHIQGNANHELIGCVYNWFWNARGTQSVKSVGIIIENLTPEIISELKCFNHENHKN